MRIAIPIDKKGMEGRVCTSFGRAPFFLIYETKTQESNVIANGALTTPGGAGIKAAQIIVDQDAKVLLTPRCGENAANVLGSAGVRLHKTISTSIEETIEDFLEGKLPPLKEIHAGLFHGGGD